MLLHYIDAIHAKTYDVNAQILAHKILYFCTCLITILIYNMELMIVFGYT